MQTRSRVSNLSTHQPGKNMSRGQLNHPLTRETIPRKLQNIKGQEAEAGRLGGHHSPWADPKLVDIVLSTRKQPARDAPADKQAKASPMPSHVGCHWKASSRFSVGLLTKIPHRCAQLLGF